MRIDIIFETICPWSFIGKKKLEVMLLNKPGLKPEIYWHTYQLDPQIPPEGLEYSAYIGNNFSDATKLEKMYSAIQHTGASVNIMFDFPRIKKAPNTRDSHRLIRYASNRHQAAGIIDSIFENYFSHGRDIGKRSILIDIGVEFGFERNDLH